MRTAALVVATLGIVAAVVAVVLLGPGTAPRPPEVRVVVRGAGGAAQLETEVALPIELAVGSLKGVARVRSVTTGGWVLVAVELAPRTDLFAGRQSVLSALQRVDLAGASPPELLPAAGRDELRVLVEARELSPVELRSIADWEVRPALLKVPGVVDAEVCGGAVRRLVVKADPAQLAAAGLKLGDLESALAVPLGAALKGGAGQSDLGALAGVPLGEGRRLADVATVSEGAAPRECLVMHDDDRDVVEVVVRPMVGQDAAGVFAAVRKALAAHASAGRSHRLTVLEGTPFRARLGVPPGLTLEKTASLCASAVAGLRAQLPGASVLGELGSSASTLPERTAAEVDLWVTFSPGGARREPADTMLALGKAAAQLPGVGLRFPDLEQETGARLFGPELAELNRLAADLSHALKKVPGVDGVAGPRGGEAPVLKVVPDREALARMGLSAAEVMNALAASSDGLTVGRTWDRGHEMDVALSVEQTEPRLVQVAPGVPLSMVAELRTVAEPVVIERASGRRYVEVRWRVRGKPVTARVLRAAAEELRLPPGYSMEWEPAP